MYEERYALDLNEGKADEIITEASESATKVSNSSRHPALRLLFISGWCSLYYVIIIVAVVMIMIMTIIIMFPSGAPFSSILIFYFILLCFPQVLPFPLFVNEVFANKYGLKSLVEQVSLSPST